MNVVETVEAVADAALNKKYLLWVHSIVLLGLLFWLCGVPCVVIIFAGLTSIQRVEALTYKNNEHAIYITKKFTQKYSGDLSTSKPDNSTLCIQIPEASRKIEVRNDVILIMTVEFQELCFNSTSYKKKGARDTARGCKSAWQHPTKC